jgi:hypothetical protein
MAAGKVRCETCNEEREIVGVKEYSGFDEKVLSCGHLTILTKLFEVNIAEIPQLLGSIGIEITPKTSGGVPVTVSGDSGVKVDGFLDPRFSFTRIGDKVDFNGPVYMSIAGYQAAPM